MNSTIIYQRQSLTIQFSASLNPKLDSLVQATCLSLNLKTYQATITVGDASFKSTTQQYIPTQTLTISLVCASDNPAKCVFNNVNQFSISNFALNFLTTDYQITGVAGKYKLRWFDRTSCYSPGEQDFNIITSQDVRFTYKPTKICGVTPMNDSVNFTWTKNGDTLFQKEETFTNMNSNVKIKIQDSPPVLVTPWNTAAPVPGFSPTNYVTDMKYYFLSCGTALTNPNHAACTQNIKYMVNDSQAQVKQITTTFVSIVKLDSSGQVTLTREFIQSVISYFYIYRNDLDDGCFASNKIMVFENRIRRVAVAGPLTQCSSALFQTLYPHDRIMVMFGVVQNADFTGEQFKFSRTYAAKDFTFGVSYDRFFDCAIMDDPAQCLIILPKIKKMQKNATFSMEMFFGLGDDQFVQKLGFPISWLQPTFDSINVTVNSSQVCIKVTNPLISGNQRVSVEIQNTNASLSYSLQTDLYFEPEITTYCKNRESTDNLKQFVNLQSTDVNAMVFFGTDKLPATTVTFFLPADPLSILWVAVFANFAIMLGAAAVVVKLKKM